MPGRPNREGGLPSIPLLTDSDVDEQRRRASLMIEYERIAAQSVIRTVRMQEQLAREQRTLVDDIARLVRVWTDRLVNVNIRIVGESPSPELSPEYNPTQLIAGEEVVRE